MSTHPTAPQGAPSTPGRTLWPPSVAPALCRTLPCSPRTKRLVSPLCTGPITIGNPICSTSAGTALPGQPYCPRCGHHPGRLGGMCGRDVWGQPGVRWHTGLRQHLAPLGWCCRRACTPSRARLVLGEASSSPSSSSYSSISATMGTCNASCHSSIKATQYFQFALGWDNLPHGDRQQREAGFRGDPLHPPNHLQ